MPLDHIAKTEMDSILNDFDEKLARRQLDFIYKKIPTTRCENCDDCCFASPEVYFSEFINIYSYIQDLPDDVRHKIAERIIRYEMLSNVTLEQKCPFLEEKKCLIYDVMPLHCRFFGLYPDEEYLEQKKESLEQNIAVAQYFARNHRLLLPREVMTYDIDQCGNNIDKTGNAMVMTRFERDLVYGQVMELENRVLPEEIVLGNENELNRFTYLYGLTQFEDDELTKLRLEIMQEFLNQKKSAKLESLIKDRKFGFGMAKVKMIDRSL